ncbi:MAG: aminoglycoside phosphotransferase family protein [Cellvibrionaceae bacterium]
MESMGLEAMEQSAEQSVEQSLLAWIQQSLAQHADITCAEQIQLSSLRGDAGFRQYFRLNTQPSLLAVCAPKTEGNSESASYFATCAVALRKQGVPTPQVIAVDEQQNFLLIEDFGEQAFLDVLSAESADLLYSEALMVLLRLQQISETEIDLPHYDRNMLRQEMSLFSEWFVSQLLDYQLNDAERQLLDETFRFLEEQALSQPKVVVHKDYHSRNLIYREGEAPGVIDFQDAVLGPITYDVVSLLKDCYIHWSPEQVKRWLITYGNLAIELGVIPPVSEAQWLKWFDTMGLQRHIKVLGIFSRLSIRDGKSGYLDDMPLVWHYVTEAAGNFPETMAFSYWCQETLLPLVKQQSWYREITSDDQVTDHKKVSPL